MSDIWTQLKAAPIPDMRALFAASPDRFAAFSASLDDLLLDYSKTNLTTETLALLLQLVETVQVTQKRDAMFAGRRINTTEDRAVLHTALRNRSGQPVLTDGKDVMPGINDTLAAMFAFAHGIRTGQITAANNAAFTDVI
ncbi:MAG: glucose-6-phosphate isomerase, partial [Acidocella sp.]|nr:glucose-6-phosphate isomerase [Acidocella sp.]